LKTLQILAKRCGDIFPLAGAPFASARSWQVDLRTERTLLNRPRMILPCKNDVHILPITRAVAQNLAHSLQNQQLFCDPARCAATDFLRFAVPAYRAIGFGVDLDQVAPPIELEPATLFEHVPEHCAASLDTGLCTGK
jgi:hypothetical protein